MLSVNFANCLVGSIGVEHGLAEHDLFGLEARLKDAHQSVMQQANAGKLGFVDLPNNTDEAKKIMSWARKVRGSFDTLVVLGIGGSALGNIAVQQALRPAYWNLSGQKGAQRLAAALRLRQRRPALGGGPRRRHRPAQDPLSTSSPNPARRRNPWPPISFSAKPWKRKSAPKKRPAHFVITTDAQKGYLRELAAREKMTTFPVPGNVGGRFSVLTPVGLVPAALTGVDLVGAFERRQSHARALPDGLPAAGPRGGLSPESNTSTISAA